jgi:serine/threonine protein kinase
MADHTPSSADPEATIPGGTTPLPRRLGHYILQESIARGGMGEVFKAQELAADGLVVVRMVALKQILHGRVETPGSVERFQREIQAAKKLDHPGIVPIYESGTVAGEHYFTMPFVPGGNLQQHVGKNPLSARQAARVICDVAHAAQYAHEHGIIHRDIKPQNILLQPNTRSSPEQDLSSSHLAVTPRLTDFGLARLVTEESGLSLSQMGEAMGTPGYMPPEQARGRLDAIGPTSDIYSLGAVLYALLTGRPPFPLEPPASVLETLDQVTHVEPLRPRLLAPQVPAELEDICLKCLEKTPAQRYSSAQQLAEALHDFLDGRPPRHTPRRGGWMSRTVRRLGRSVHRHPVRSAYLAASIATVLVLVMLLLSYQAQTRKQAQQVLTEAEQEVAAAREAERKGDRGAALEKYALAREKFNELIAAPGHLRPLRLRLARAEVYQRRGAILSRDPRDFRQARDEYDLARAELESLQAKYPRDPERRRLLAEVYHGLGVLCSNQQTHDRQRESLAFYRMALPLRQELCQEYPDNRDYLRDLARNYGFMGDTQLELDDEAGAKDSYDQAALIRDRIIGLVPANRTFELIDALCQRARDYGNLGNYLERISQPHKALEQYLRRADFYRNSPQLAGLSRLPGEFWTDRADNLVTIADLQMDLTGAVGDSLALVGDALKEYAILATSLRPGEKNRELESSVAQALLVRGQAYSLAGKADLARDDLIRARDDLYQLTAAGEPQASDLFNLAVAHAWLGRLAGPGKDATDNGAALAKLREAVNRGFNHLPRLERERGFQRLRVAEETRRDYAALVKKLRKSPRAGLTDH